ncbi:MAG TPA: pyruvate, phosphate dikinase [Bryobacteraceae bacterium]|nr:pyruvate, phosphate dikinase [Bryobacteraceae bacterium]
MSKHVYSFGGGTADGHGQMKEVLGGKGAGLHEMSRAGIPVPPGFTISTDVCNIYFQNNNSVPEEINQEIAQALDRLEKEVGKKFGDHENPLLLSVRSGARFSMPGMMNTILNLGLNDETVEGLSAKTGNPRFAYDSYRRFIQMFGEVALNIDMEKFDHIFDERKRKSKVKLDTELTDADLKAIVADYKKLVEKETKKPFPQDAREQLALSRDAVFRSWWNPKASYYRKMEKIPDDIGTAANVQTMVFGNTGEHSATGVGFTRDPSTGEKVFWGEYLLNAQGEDVVAGIRTPEPISHLAEVMPAAYEQLHEITTSLEKHYKDMQDFEFTIEDGKLWMLQTRNGKRTGPAAVRVAVDMVEEGLISQRDAVLRVAPAQLDQLLHPIFDTKTLKTLTKLTTGIAASPGAAVGRVSFTAEDAVEAAKSGPVILVRKETTPDDIHGMDVSKGILTAIGGKSSHAAVVARGMGRPCVVGAGELRIDEHKKQCTVGKAVIKEGDWISFDGATADVYQGKATTVEPDPTSGYFGKLMAWADEFRGNFGVRANADIPRDAKAARAFGAEGIGLCRTEHMFFAEDRIEHMQAMILADDEKSRKKALLKLLPMQRKDFAGLFEAMDGLPVIIRTLDPPLHEFLPKREELMVDIAVLPSADAKQKKGLVEKYRRFQVNGAGDLKKVLPNLLKRVEDLHEFNPMLGFRGCRLGIRYPEITEMQARAIFEAVVQVAKKGIKVIPEVMIPLVGFEKELQLQKEIVVRVADEVLEKAGMKDLHYMVGTMIEIVRGALTAELVAKDADFFSFGTNDLTQTTLGMSRDDYTKFSKFYEEVKIFKADPFATIDQEGVGRVIETAIRLGRQTRPDLEIGICGEHGGDPESVGFCYRVGMNYVSCSPYRVPIARLAAAQAAISGSDKSEAMRTA